MSQPGWKKTKRKRLSSLVILPTEYASLNVQQGDDEGVLSKAPVSSDLQALWDKLYAAESSKQQLACLKEINKCLLHDDRVLNESERDSLQKALSLLLLNPESSHQVRSVVIKIQASLGERCPPLEEGLRRLLAAAAPAPPSAIQLLEFLADHTLGRRLLLDCLEPLMIFFREELRFHSESMCAMISPVELAAAAGPGQRAVRLLMVTLQVLQPLSPQYDLEAVRAARDALERLLTLPALPWDLRGNCGMAYVLLCLAARDRDLTATVLNAAFPSADLCGSAEAGPVPLAGWPLTAQLALLAGCVHALPAEQLLQPAGGGGALLTMLLGWLLHAGMSVSDTATLLGFSRGVLSALGRITEACRGGPAPTPAPSDPAPGDSTPAVTESDPVAASTPAPTDPSQSSAADESPAVQSADQSLCLSFDFSPSSCPTSRLASPAAELSSLLPDVLVQDLLQYVWRLMADDAQSVRGVAADMLSSLVALFAGFPDGPFLRELTTSVLALPLHLRRRCRALRCLLPAVGVGRLLAACPALPRQLVGVLGDPAVSTHAVELYCVLLSEHWRSLGAAAWLSVWVDPLFESDTVPPAALAQITGRIALLAPGSAAYVTRRVSSRRRVPRHLWLVQLTAVQAAHRQGAPGQNWRDALPLERLTEALRHTDDQVRIAALAVLADSKKTSELFEPAELRLIVRFVAANMANQTPAFRQQLLALMKKILVRLSDGTAALLRKVGGAERRASIGSGPTASSNVPARSLGRASSAAPEGPSGPAVTARSFSVIGTTGNVGTITATVPTVPTAPAVPIVPTAPPDPTVPAFSAVPASPVAQSDAIAPALPIAPTAPIGAGEVIPDLAPTAPSVPTAPTALVDPTAPAVTSADVPPSPASVCPAAASVSTTTVSATAVSAAASATGVSAASAAALPALDRLQQYQSCLRRLFRLPFAGLFPGANFPRRTTCLQLLTLLEELFGGLDRPVMSTAGWWGRDQLYALLYCLTDCYDNNKELALQLLCAHDLTVLDLQAEELDALLGSALSLASSARPPDSQTAAYLLRAIVRLPGAAAALRRRLDAQLRDSPHRDSLRDSLSEGSPAPERRPSDPAASDTDAAKRLRTPSLTTVAEASETEAETDGIDGDDGTDGTADPPQEEKEEEEPGRLLLELLLARLESEVTLAESALTAAAATAPMHGLMLCVRLLLAAEQGGSGSTGAGGTGVKCWRGVGGRLVSLCRRASAAVLPVVSSASPEGHLPMDLQSAAVLKLEAALSRALAPAAVPTEPARTRAVTSQMLLICCWRTMKELCLLLGDLSQRLPVSPAPSAGELTPDQLLAIGRHFMALLAETKHRGAFEQAHVGFSRVCATLWRSPLPELNSTPARWLDEVLADIRGEGRQTLCSTRRSAGLPFLMQALLTSEPSVIGSAYFSRAMVSLLSAAAAGGKTAVHAMNVLRALFRDARLGDSVGVHVTAGIRTAVSGFKAATSSERNSASLLFSALVTRVFGVQRSRDTLAKKNCMTGRLFFLRHPELYQFLLEEMDTAREPFPVLLLLARLYPSPVEGADAQYPLRAFLPALERAAASPVLQTRRLAARAICSLVPYWGYPEATLALLDSIERDGTTRQNLLHGRLLQVQHMLRHCVLETSMYTTPDLLRWRPSADRALKLADLLAPSNRCAVTAAAAADALSAAVRLGYLLSAPPPPPAVEAAASELLMRSTSGGGALYGAETARVAAVGLLWTLGEERSVCVAKLEGYDPLQRHLQLMKELLTLEQDGNGGETVGQPSRLSPVARPAPVPDLGVRPDESPVTPEQPDGVDDSEDTPSSERDDWLTETASALRLRLSDASRPLPAPCLQTALSVLTLMGSAAADWDGTVCEVVRRLAAATALSAAQQPVTPAEERDDLEQPEMMETLTLEKPPVTVTVDEAVTGSTTQLQRQTSTQLQRQTSSGEPAPSAPPPTPAPEFSSTTGQQWAVLSVDGAAPEVAALCRAAASHENVRADFIRLATSVLDRLSPQIFTDSATVPGGSSGAALLDAWCRLVGRCCSVDGAVTLRQAACHATAAALLWPTRQLTVSQEAALWRSLVTLLADDEPDVRQAAVEVVDALDTTAAEKHAAHDQNSWEEEADSVLHRAVTVFCARMAPRDLRRTVHTLLLWIFTDDDGGQLGRAQEDEERVFDKGEMNIFSEDALLVRAAAGALVSLLPELPEQPLLLSVRQLTPLPLVRHLPSHYQLELSDLLRQAARHAEAALRRLTPGARGVAQRGRPLICLRAFRRLRLAAGLREFFLEPEVDDLWQRSVAMTEEEYCFRPLWKELLDS